MALILATVTDGAGGLTGVRRSLPKMLGGTHLLAFVPIIPGGYFKMGTGVSALDDTLTDLETPFAIGTAGAGTDGKALVAADVTYVSPNTLRIQCKLGLAEGNGVPGGSYFEIGIFDAADRMIAIGKMAAQPKTGGNELENYVNISF